MIYQKMDEAVREQALKAMKRDYPDVPMDWLKMTYDFVIQNPDRAEKIVNGEEEVPPPKPRGEVKYGCTIYKDEDEMKRIENNVGKMELIS